MNRAQKFKHFLKISNVKSDNNNKSSELFSKTFLHSLLPVCTTFKKESIFDPPPPTFLTFLSLTCSKPI